MTKVFQRGKSAVLKFFTAWSFSRLRDYIQCPAYAKYKHIDKRKEPDHPASARGTKVHEDADKFVSGKIPLPTEFKPFRKDFENLRKVKAKTEQEWAFDVDWNKVDWFAKNAWLRIKVDSHYLTAKKGKRQTETTVTIIDYKTGKVHKDVHKIQRGLYALGALLVYPDAMTVVVEHWYIDSGELHQDSFKATELEALKKEWAHQAVPMMRDRRFAPRPGNHCRWCHYRKSNKGPCIF